MLKRGKGRGANAGKIFGLGGGIFEEKKKIKYEM